MLLYSILAILFWGIWGFLGKLATKYNSPLAVTCINNLIAPLFGLFLLLFVKNRMSSIDIKFPALLFIFLVMAAGTLGTLAFYGALSHGSASIVVSMTALYPIVTIILSMIFFKETFSFLQVIGFVLVFTGAVLLNINK
ncbi:EamA family transporter [candidate division WOR-3 bacterium]|nr:EamA family transporter [candidate division WOR-3 bacterium]